MGEMQLPTLEYDQDTGVKLRSGEKCCGIFNDHESDNVLFLILRTKPRLAECLLPLAANLV